jgi:hypothetical protein
MRLFLAIGLAIVFALSAAASASGQNRMPGPAESNTEDKRATLSRNYGSLIAEVFAPITDKLKLSNEQQFEIIAIITETEIRADPWVQSLGQIEIQLSEIAFNWPVNELKLRELTDQQAVLLTEIIQMKVRAKANIYRLLTPQQRALVAQEFRFKSQLEGHQ